MSTKIYIFSLGSLLISEITAEVTLLNSTSQAHTFCFEGRMAASSTEYPNMLVLRFSSTLYLSARTHLFQNAGLGDVLGAAIFH